MLKVFGPRSVTTSPPVLNVWSRVPFELYCARANSFPSMPATTILPPGVTEMLVASEKLFGPKSVRTSPPVPNVVSRLPFVLYRTTTKSSAKLLLRLPSNSPATRILPSDWIAMALAAMIDP